MFQETKQIVFLNWIKVIQTIKQYSPVSADAVNSIAVGATAVVIIDAVVGQDKAKENTIENV